ncbi:MAG: hypothetical protein H6729_08220 [Deltaproteobacteria bacterium]|nr:hypothetical protein [Deltaproteobacteria bacterium]
MSRSLSQSLHTDRIHRLVAVPLLLFACSTSSSQPGAGSETESRGPTTSTKVAEPSQQGLLAENGLEMNGAVGNGLYVNGLSFNGLYTNGLYVNGLETNGLPVNGLPLNGLPLNGLYVNGLYVNGIGSNGLPVNGLPLNGLYVNGLPLNGLPVNGLPLNGLYVNGLPLNGLYVNGLPVNGLSLNGLYVNGLYVNGLYVNGLPVNGLYVNGLWPNGLYVNGLPLNGLPLNGLYVNGADPTTSIQIATDAGQLANLSSEQEASFESMMAHLVWCALPEGDTATIFDSSGIAQTYPGHHGLAPTWKTSALVDDPDGIDDSEELRWCMEHYRAPIDASSVYQGLALNNRQAADFEKLMKYVVSCALDAGDSLSMSFPSGVKTFQGGLGLAPGWKDGALDDVGQRAVSACLGARTNAHGTTVRISLRNANFASLSASPLERENFKTHEGAFWGNLFGSNPGIHACKVEGGGPAGRLCTDGGCGFTPNPIPSCFDPASGGCSQQDGFGNWTHCGDEHEDVVFNTFLTTDERFAAGAASSCAIRSDNSVACWGQCFMVESGNSVTPLDGLVHVLGLPDPSSDPANVPAQLSSGKSQTFVRLRGGALYGWSMRRCDDVNAHAQRVDELGEDVALIEAGANHSCAIKMDGTLWCRGSNTYHVFGPFDSSHAYYEAFTQVGAELGNTIVNVAVGAWHTCVLRMDGTVWCIGARGNGELGDGFTSGFSDVFVRIGESSLGNEVVQISTEQGHTCARKSDGTLWCWGENSSGQLGDGTFFTRSTPVRVGESTLGHDVKSVSVADYHTCALKTDGIVWCWGGGLSRSVDFFTIPHRVHGITHVTSISSGCEQTTMMLPDLSRWVVGDDYDSAMWDGSINAPSRVIKLVKADDGLCETTESTLYESGDCVGIDDLCGNGVCDAGETCSVCASDCPTTTYYCDSDGDGYGLHDCAYQVCGGLPVGYASPYTEADCNDSNASINPSAYDGLDGVDDDCDGFIDEYQSLVPDLCDFDYWTSPNASMTCLVNPLGAVLTQGTVEDLQGQSGGLHYEVTAVAEESTGRKKNKGALRLEAEEWSGSTRLNTTVGAEVVIVPGGGRQSVPPLSIYTSSTGNRVRIRLVNVNSKSMHLHELDIRTVD